MTLGRASLLTVFIAGFLAEAGVIGAHDGLLLPMVGFRVFLLSFIVAIFGVFLGLLGIIRASGGDRLRRGAATGLALGALIALSLGFALMRLGSIRFTGLNDVTTNFQDPPHFVNPPGGSAASMEYDRLRLEPIQQRYYPGLGPLLLSESADDAFVSVKQAANVPRFAGMEIARQVPSMPGWFIVFVDPKTRTIEGVETSFLFRFSEDFVIQVRPGTGPKTSLVEMRSRSRNQVGDFAANYNRIVDFLGLVKSHAGTAADSAKSVLNISQTK
jgi:uncharacterized protein DUF1499